MGKETPSVLERFKAARLYVVTSAPKLGQGYEELVEAICAGGADVVQFRDKLITGKERYQVAGRLRTICARHKVLFIVNDALEVALAVEADGVHLGQDDLPVKNARALIHPMGVKNFLIGCSTHSVAQAVAAEEDGADYIGIGPVFATPTKPTYEPIGLELVRLVTAQVKVPHVAIGGIDFRNVEHVLKAGAQRVAVVRAVCGAENVTQAARELKSVFPEKVEVS